MTSYKQLITAENYDTLMTAIRTIWAKQPSVRVVLNSVIKTLTGTIRKYCIKQNTPEYDQLLANIDKFIVLHKDDYRSQISKHARKEIAHQKLAKGSAIPTSSDVQKYSTYLKTVAQDAYRKLQTPEKGFDFSAWMNLGKATLLQVYIFLINYGRNFY